MNTSNLYLSNFILQNKKYIEGWYSIKAEIIIILFLSFFTPIIIYLSFNEILN